jgi:hypothetical protein
LLFSTSLVSATGSLMAVDEMGTEEASAAAAKVGIIRADDAIL